MARQEVIDGPGVAAKILSRFPAEEREHLVATIRAEEPKVAATLERRMSNLPSVERSSAIALQTPVREVPSRDIPPLREIFEAPARPHPLESAPEPTLEILREEPSGMSPQEVTEIEAAQARILKRLEELYPEETNSNARKPFKSRLA